jgi:hypothetical protein
MKRQKTPEPIEDDDEDLSPELKRELARRLADARNPVRYVVYSEMLPRGRWRLFLDVSGDGYWNTIDEATLFKCERVARAVATVYAEGRRRDLLVARITTKNGKRKVLEFERSDDRSRRSTRPRPRAGVGEAKQRSGRGG